MPTRPWRNLLNTFENTMSRSPFNGKILLSTFVLGVAISSILALQSAEWDQASPWTLNSVSTSDFTITASLPSVVPADGFTPATSIIVINPLNDFTGTVALSDVPLPLDMTCKAIDPASIRNALGMATLSCTSAVAGIYAVTIAGVSGGISHNTTRTFAFAASPPPDFMITTIDTVSFNSGSTATSNVTVTLQGGFDSQVKITTTIYPTIGLSVSLNPQDLTSDSELSTATFSSSSPGDYTVMITGTSQGLSHTIRVVVTVTPVGIPDFGISATPGSINIEAGNEGTTRIIITPNNGFANAVSFTIATPAGIACSLSSVTIRFSGTSTLTCNSNKPGDYPVTITASGGASSHTTIVNVHVVTVMPVVSVPSPVLGLAPDVFYGIITGTILLVVAGTVLVLRTRHPSS